MGLLEIILKHNADCVVADLERASFVLETSFEVDDETACQLVREGLDKLAAAHRVAKVVAAMAGNLAQKKEVVPKSEKISVDTLGIVASPGRPPENGPFDSPDTMAKREGVTEE